MKTSWFSWTVKRVKISKKYLSNGTTSNELIHKQGRRGQPLQGTGSHCLGPRRRRRRRDRGRRGQPPQGTGSHCLGPRRRRRRRDIGRRGQPPLGTGSHCLGPRRRRDLPIYPDLESLSVPKTSIQMNFRKQLLFHIVTSLNFYDSNWIFVIFAFF